MDNLLISVATSGMCKSLCNVRLETYHGALVMDSRDFDCSRWMICVWDGFAQPQSFIPYVHTGLSTHICTREVCFQGKALICVPPVVDGPQIP